MPSGPGHEEGEHLRRACLISSRERGVWLGCGVSLPFAGGGGFRGKECSKRAVLIAVGESATGRVGNLGVLRGATYCLAVQMF